MTMQGSKKLPVVKLVDSLEASWDYVANEGTTFTLQTNYKAPRCRCVCSAAVAAVVTLAALAGRWGLVLACRLIRSLAEQWQSWQAVRNASGVHR